MREPQGEKVRAFEMLNNGCTQLANSRATGGNSRAAENCGGKPVVGSSMKDHGSKPKVEKRGQQFLGRCKSRRPSSLPTDFRSFVGTDGKSVSVPPACMTNGKGKDFLVTEVDTHRHTHHTDCRAGVHPLCFVVSIICCLLGTCDWTATSRCRRPR